MEPSPIRGPHRPGFHLGPRCKGRKGRRHSFTTAAPPAQADKLFSYFVTQVKATGLKVATGRFQAYMQVGIQNDGPVTILLDSREKS
ncbi:MAG: D-aminoacyl-tRNA deacylase [Chloroflexi bacterium]|nr:D-aminoacyl-tRNA deacylase [Chloroflexota bacterium]